MERTTMLGDEAIAVGAIHAGLGAAYGYPGTPSTEILEVLLHYQANHDGPKASWATNEKTALEQALGASLAGLRTIVTMKHVGLNVASDPFMNAAVAAIHGGLVVAVADDPGMHSSQNEQDSRYYADFAHTICLEPADQQQAYDMTRYAFDLSKKFKVPVMLRLVTRLAHSRAQLELKPPKAKVQLGKTTAPKDWILMPANSRRRWNERLEQWPEIEKLSENSSYNPLTLNSKRLGVITTGLALNYYLENAEELTSEKPSHLHIGLYPFPQEKVRKLLAHCEEVIIIEEGYPYIERFIRGVVEPKTKLRGKLDKFIPPAGELTPEIVRKALGLKIHDSVKTPAGLNLPGRPPQLCQGCPHCDSYASLKKALEAVGATPDKSMVTGDIGCYTLGALPPYSAIQSCICMGGSISMAKGAADAGLHPVVAMIGDSTFLHSGIQPLIDATAANTPMTVMILDNAAVAMTGGQQTALPSSRLREIVAGIGVSPDHLHVLDAHRMKIDANAEIIKKELEHKGLSVIITYRECLETAKRKKK